MFTCKVDITLDSLFPSVVGRLSNRVGFTNYVDGFDQDGKCQKKVKTLNLGVVSKEFSTFEITVSVTPRLVTSPITIHISKHPVLDEREIFYYLTPKSID